MILQMANELQITFEVSEVVSFGTLINGAMLGVLVALAFRIPNSELAAVSTTVPMLKMDARPSLIGTLESNP